jgi:hypothetical protein
MKRSRSDSISEELELYGDNVKPTSSDWSLDYGTTLLKHEYSETSEEIESNEEWIEKLYDEKSAQKITAMRQKERAALSGRKQLEYDDFLGSINSLFWKTEQLISGPLETPESQDTYQELETEAINAVTEIGKAINEIILKLAKAPYNSSLVKELDLLTKTIDSMANFFSNPQDFNSYKQLVESSQQVNKKMGLLWTPLKLKLLAAVGIACIVIGALGLLPSFGGSIALMALGGVLCAHAGIKTFESLTRSKVLQAFPENVDKLLALGKQVVALETKAAAKETEAKYSLGQKVKLA